MQGESVWGIQGSWRMRPERVFGIVGKKEREALRQVRRDVKMGNALKS